MKEAIVDLDQVFHALADGTRRAILMRLANGDATVRELTEPFDMSQPAVSKHLRVLEQAGLVGRSVDQQRRPASLKPERLITAVSWLFEFRPMWGTSFDQLDELLFELQNTDKEENER